MSNELCPLLMVSAYMGFVVGRASGLLQDPKAMTTPDIAVSMSCKMGDCAWWNGRYCGVLHIGPALSEQCDSHD